MSAVFEVGELSKPIAGDQPIQRCLVSARVAEPDGLERAVGRRDLFVLGLNHPAVKLRGPVDEASAVGNLWGGGDLERSFWITDLARGELELCEQGPWVGVVTSIVDGGASAHGPAPNADLPAGLRVEVRLQPAAEPCALVVMNVDLRASDDGLVGPGDRDRRVASRARFLERVCEAAPGRETEKISHGGGVREVVFGRPSIAPATQKDRGEDCGLAPESAALEELRREASHAPPRHLVAPGHKPNERSGPQVVDSAAHRGWIAPFGPHAEPGMVDDDLQRRQRESDAFNANGIEAADRKWYEEAERCFRRAIELDPTSAHAHDNLATVYSEQGKLLPALGEYLEALRIEPDNPMAHYNLAWFLTAQGPQMAIQEYQEAIRLEYDYPDAHVNLGLCYADGGDMENAIAEFRIAIELDPSDVGAKQELAAALIDTGEFAEAIRLLREVVRLRPNELDGFIDLGIAYMEQGFYEEAERSLKSAAELGPSEVLPHYHLAALYASWDRIDEALRALTTAVSIDPSRTRDWARGDRLFDPLREDPEFVRILGEQ